MHSKFILYFLDKEFIMSETKIIMSHKKQLCMNIEISIITDGARCEIWSDFVIRDTLQNDIR